MPVLTGPVVTTPISIATSGDNLVIAAATGKKVYLLSAFLVAAGTVTLNICDGAGTSTSLSGVMSMAVAVPFPIPQQNDQRPQFSTSSGNGLNFNLGGNVQVSGWIQTVQV